MTLSFCECPIPHRRQRDGLYHGLTLESGGYDPFVSVLILYLGNVEIKPMQ